MNVVIISNKQVIKIFKCDSINVFITGESTRCCRWRLQLVVLLFGYHLSTREKDTLIFIFGEVYSGLLRPRIPGSNNKECVFFLNENVHITITVLILSFCLCSVLPVPQVPIFLDNVRQSTMWCFTPVLPGSSFNSVYRFTSWQFYSFMCHAGSEGL